MRFYLVLVWIIDQEHRVYDQKLFKQRALSDGVLLRIRVGNPR